MNQEALQSQTNYYVTIPTSEAYDLARLHKLLLAIGVPPNIYGYSYILRSIELILSNPEYMHYITKGLYIDVAKDFHATPSRVERAIRHAIEVAWDRGDVDTLNSYFGYTIHNSRGKPTNSEFIAMIADNLRLKYKYCTV